MSAIDGVVNLSSLQTLGQVQMAVAAKVLNAQKAEGQLAVELLDAALEGVQQMVEETSQTLDVTA